MTQDTRPRPLRPQRSIRFRISEFMAQAIQARGGEADRDSERQFRDLQVARDARETGR